MNSAAEKLMSLSNLKNMKWVSLILGVSNLVALILGGFLLISVSLSCSRGKTLPFGIVFAAACFKIMSMVGSAIAQKSTAMMILRQLQMDDSVVDTVRRHEIRMRYKRWLWWTRCGRVVTILQFVGAIYLTFITVKYVSFDGKSSGCFLGNDTNRKGWKQILVLLFLILAWLLVIIQCKTGFDVLRWRSFYTNHDNAWKAHYREVFGHGIREALCCLGRVKYIKSSRSALEEDETYTVARVLGDLVAYRASGTGHLEFLAGLALLQRHRQSTSSYEELKEAPEAQIREAAFFHQFAEAAYTGPLLDFGRNPVLFSCMWIYRQGVLTPWTWKRRPLLKGDNWWRGHAAAFLKYANLSPEALRQGRVGQEKREAAYFVVVLHHLKTVVIAVRGTETPEDLITDGLCRECTLSVEDLDGLINSDHLGPEVKQNVLESFPHYGHSGVVETARELYMQIDGQPGDKDDCPRETSGFLSSLLGVGCECHGYSVRIVGHSLGGAVGTVLGLRLRHRYPTLRVYSYGTLPCVDSIIAEACSDFVTSIVYNDEFSARLSVTSIFRLRAAAITALSQNSLADSAMICKLAQRILHLNKYPESRDNETVSAPSVHSTTMVTEDSNHAYKRKRFKYRIKGGIFLCVHAVSCMLNMPNHRHCFLVRNQDCELSSGLDLEGVYDNAAAGSSEQGQNIFRQETSSFDNVDSEILMDGYDETSFFDNVGIKILEVSDTAGTHSAILKDSFDESNHSSIVKNCTEPHSEEANNALSCGDPVSQCMDSVTPFIEGSIRDPTEMFLPGFIIHIVPEQRGSLLPLWKSWKAHDREHSYRAYVATRENFKDIIVSPYMFLDHLPWRCHYAMKRVLKARKARG